MNFSTIVKHSTYIHRHTWFCNFSVSNEKSEEKNTVHISKCTRIHKSSMYIMIISFIKKMDLCCFIYILCLFCLIFIGIINNRHENDVNQDRNDILGTTIAMKVFVRCFHVLIVVNVGECLRLFVNLVSAVCRHKMIFILVTKHF